MDPLQKIAKYLKMVSGLIGATEKIPQGTPVELGWLDPPRVIKRAGHFKNEETQILVIDNAMCWIANNHRGASEAQRMFLSALGINQLVTLQAHVNEFYAAIAAYCGLKDSPDEAVPAKTDTHQPAAAAASSPAIPSRFPSRSHSSKKVMPAKKIAAHQPAAAAVSSPSMSSPSPSARVSIEWIEKPASGTPTIHTEATSSANLGPVNMLGSSMPFKAFAFVALGYEAEEGDDGVVFHAEQQLLAALSMLDKRFVAGRTFKLAGCKPPCAVCKPVIDGAIASLADLGCVLELVAVTSVTARKESHSRTLNGRYFPSMAMRHVRKMSEITPHLPDELNRGFVPSLIASYLTDT